MQNIIDKKESPKRKKTQKEYYQANPEKYYGYYKNFVERNKSLGIDINEKYKDTNKRCVTNYDYKRNAIRCIKYLFK